MLTLNKSGQSTSNVIKHAASLPVNTPTSNFESNLYMITGNPSSNLEARNPLRSAILPTKVSLVMPAAPANNLQKPKALRNGGGY